MGVEGKEGGGGSGLFLTIETSLWSVDGGGGGGRCGGRLSWKGGGGIV